MVSKANFAPEEWARIVASPMVAGMAITAADPSGPWGLLQEGISGGRSLLDAKQNAAGNLLAKAVAEDITNADTRGAARDWMQAQFKGTPVGEMKNKALDELRRVAALVDAKAPQEAVGFKSWLRGTAQKAAEAAKEGGFLGFGGVDVSDAERATLFEVSAALGMTAEVDRA